VKKTGKKISKLFRYWVSCLGLRWWEVDLKFYDDPGAILENFGNDGDILVLAKTTVSWEYGLATIRINLPGWKDLDNEHMENAVVHELSHVLVAELQYSNDMHHVEHTVTTLTRAFIWTRDSMLKGGNNNG